MQLAEKSTASPESFQAHYKPLSARFPNWGSVALLPWDEAVFGFPVADFVWGEIPPPLTKMVEFREALNEFSRESGATLVSARAKSEDTAKAAFLVSAGFIPVDFSVMAVRSRLRADQLPPARFPLRRATPEDHADILRISGRAFTYGRYHRDPWFPRPLADKRYIGWMQRALADESPANHIFVLGGLYNVLGFMNVVIRDHYADLRLGAVDPDNELGFAGFPLYAETLRAVHALGAHAVIAKIAAGNTRILNICAALRFQFSHPETTLHWHSPAFPKTTEPSPANRFN